MTKKQNKARENRIDMQIVVNACDGEECIAGWYCYFEDVLKFPFKAKCIN